MTMKEIAHALGVSQTTVSLTLSGKADRYGISANTQTRVREYVRAVGYVPDIDAAAMAAGHVRQVGIIIPSEARNLTESQRALFFDLLQLLHRTGVTPLIQAIDAETCYDGIRFLAGKKVEDLVVVGFNTITLCEACPDLLPIVRRRRMYLVDYLFLHAPQPEPLFPNAVRIGIDRVTAFTTALTHLQELGHATIAAPDSVRYYLPEHCPGLRLLTLPLPPRIDDHFEWGRQLAPEVMRLRQAADCTAIMLRNDMMALGLITALREAGIQVPADLSVSGFDSIPAAAYAAVPITTLEVPGQAMLEVLHARMTHWQTGDRDCYLPGRIIPRASTGRAPVRAVSLV